MATQPQAPVPAAGMAEDTQSPEMAPEMAPTSPGETETVEVPAASIGASMEGDTVQFKVISVDQQNGVATLSPVMAENQEMGGSDDMAAEFGKDKMEGKM